MLTIRKAGKDDIPLIRELCFAIWPQTYRPIISEEQIGFMLEKMYSTASLERQMTEEGCTFILAHDEDTPVGFASYNEIAPFTWKLNKLYVLTSQQGKGTGRFMLQHIVDEIKKQGARSLQLQVNRGNKARDFYERLGFKIIREADFDIGNGFFMNDYVMERILT